MFTGKGKYTEPAFNQNAFHCPYDECSVYSEQIWNTIHSSYKGAVSDWRLAYCTHCARFSLWVSEKLVYPEKIGAVVPNNDMDESIKQDFNEAREILNRSPKGAAALLRLCIQKLCVQLRGKGKNLNNDIADLVKKGLPEKIQKALDIVRVIGNGAVHPGQIDVNDNIQTANKLFDLVNIIAYTMITQPKDIDELYNGLPEEKLEQIELRDAPNKT